MLIVSSICYSNKKLTNIAGMAYFTNRESNTWQSKAVSHPILLGRFSTCENQEASSMLFNSNFYALSRRCHEILL
jgi:hypothetical protein